MKKHNIGLKIVGCLFVIFLIGGFVRNFNVLYYFVGFISHSDWFNIKISDYINGYRENINDKELFVDINSIYVNAIGKSIANERFKNKDDVLIVQNFDFTDMKESGTNIVNLNKYLEEKDIPFVYVQMPYKLPLEADYSYADVDNHANGTADSLLEILKDNNVNYIDLRPEFSRTEEQVKENFYRTDHHWKPTAALKATKEIFSFVEEKYPDVNLSTELLDEDNWQIHSKSKWHLGSDGKRTGIFFAGIDDILWLTPKFETDMEFIVPSDNIDLKGKFEDTVIIKWPLKFMNPHYNNAYCVYIGYDYGLTKHINDNAPIDKKVLIVKDSFSLPVQSFLSTVFKDVHAVDLRSLNEQTLVEHINEFNPDIVIMAYNPSTLTDDSMFEYDTKMDKS